MNSIYFNNDHDELRNIIRKFIENKMVPYEEKWEEEGIFPIEIIQELGELGFLGIKYPEKYEGLNLDYFSNVVFIEELGRTFGGASLSIFTHIDIASNIIYLSGNEEQKEKFLIPSIKGKMLGALAITEPDYGSDVSGIKTKAEENGDFYIINGSKTYITNGSRADYIVLAAKTNSKLEHKGISLFILETKNLDGFKIGKKLNKLGNRASDTTELFFDNVKVHKNNLLGEKDKGFYEIMKNFQGERLGAAIMSYSMAEKVWEDAYRYTKERKVFGKPISNFQINTHKLVDMYTEIQASKQLALNACWLYSKGFDCLKEVSMAKLNCAEMSFKVINQALQLYGGAGYIMEYSVQRALRDSRLLSIAGGTSEIMKEIIAKKLSI